MSSITSGRKYSLSFGFFITLLTLPLKVLAVLVPVYLHDKLTNLSMEFPDASTTSSSLHRQNEETITKDGTESDVADDVMAELNKILPTPGGMDTVAEDNVLLGKKVFQAVHTIASVLDKGGKLIDEGKTSLTYSELYSEKPQTYFSDESSSFVSRFEGDCDLEPLDMDSEQSFVEDSPQGGGESSHRPGRVTVRLKVYKSPTEDQQLKEALPTAVVEFVFQREEGYGQEIVPLMVHIFNPQVTLGHYATLIHAGKEIYQRANSDAIIGYPAHCRPTSNSMECWTYKMSSEQLVRNRALTVGISSGGVGLLLGGLEHGFHHEGVAAAVVGGMTYFLQHPAPAAALCGVTAAAVGGGMTYLHQRHVRGKAALSSAINALLCHILSPASPIYPISVRGMLTGDPRDTSHAVIRWRSTPVYDENGQPLHTVLPAGLRKRK